MAKQARSGGNPALKLAMIRRIHTYLGVFIAPSVLFFACTGALQLFSLHEAHGAYQPPALIEKLGMVHKDQVFAAKPKKPAAAQPAAPKATDPDHEHHEAGSKVGTQVLKWLFLLVAASLATSTILGLWMGLRYGRDKTVAWALLVAGAVLPVLILAL